MRTRSDRQKKGGYAMVLVICVMALFTALCLALLLSTSAVLAAAQKQKNTEQCRILADSLSRRLEQELTSPAYSFDNAKAEQQARDDSLWFYVKREIGSGLWPAGGEDTSACRRFRFDTQPEILGEGSEITLCWRTEDDLNGAVLTAAVTCSYADQSCTVVTDYSLQLTELSYVNNATVQSYECWQWSLSGRK